MGRDRENNHPGLMTREVTSGHGSVHRELLKSQEQNPIQHKDEPASTLPPNSTEGGLPG